MGGGNNGRMGGVLRGKKIADLFDEERKFFHDEAKRHHPDAGSNPSEERPLIRHVVAAVGGGALSRCFCHKFHSTLYRLTFSIIFDTSTSALHNKF